VPYPKGKRKERGEPCSATLPLEAWPVRINTSFGERERDRKAGERIANAAAGSKSMGVDRQQEDCSREGVKNRGRGEGMATAPASHLFSDHAIDERRSFIYRDL